MEDNNLAVQEEIKPDFNFAVISKTDIKNEVQLQVLAPIDPDLKKYTDIAAAHLIPQGATIAPPEVVFEINGISLFTKKSISLIIAKAKAGKTTVTAWVIGQVLKARKKTLWIDTEQGAYYGSWTQMLILKIGGLVTSGLLSYYDLKIYNPTERIKIIEAILSTSHFDIVVIDGVRDLVFDINSPEESTNISTSLMKWADMNNTHILSILHQNKSDGNARGHLGAELVNKSETVIKVSQNEYNEMVVEPEYTRGKPFEAFAVVRNDDGIPELLENWTSIQIAEKAKSESKRINPVDIDPATHNEIVGKIFSKEANLKYNDVVSNIQYFFKLHGIEFGQNKAKEYCTYYQMQGMVIKNEELKGYAKYQSGLTLKVV